MERPETSGANALAGPTAEAHATGKVEVVYALPGRQRVIELPLLPDGLTARDAVERSGLLAEFPELATQPLVLGVYGAVCDGERRLRDGDRVEIYRPLRQDPRTLRRERAASAPRKGGRR
jgi:putative ubiquitin-RnfH superfamily antitoxin RatB of RatAB toxin-antitoxin module